MVAILLLFYSLRKATACCRRLLVINPKACLRVYTTVGAGKVSSEEERLEVFRSAGDELLERIEGELLAAER